MTPLVRVVADAVADHKKRRGEWPTVRELSDGLDMPRTTVYHYLVEGTALGILERANPGSRRCFRTPTPGICPQCGQRTPWRAAS